MPLTLDQATPLAALLHKLRPEWDERGILKALEKCAGRNAFDVAMAALRATADMGAKTPGVIPSDGPHWRERLSENRSPRNPLPHEECSDHPGQYRLSCSGCRSEKLAPVVPLQGQRIDRDAALALARANLAQSKAQLCSHGVRPRLCKEAHDEDPTPAVTRRATEEEP